MKSDFRMVIILFFLLSCILGGCAAGSDGISGIWIRDSANKKHSIQVVSDKVRAGKKAIRFELRPGDHWYGNKGYKELAYKFRTELSGYNNFIASAGKDYWYGFSMLISEDFESNVIQTILGQWWSSPDSGETLSRTPLLAQHYEYGRFRIILSHNEQKIQLNDKHIEEILYDNIDFEKGVWHDFIYHVKWSYKDDGYVKVWIDGKPEVDYKGPVGYNDNNGPFFKYGIYVRPAVHSPLIVYFDEYRRGNSYEEVDPAGNHYSN